MFYSEKDKWKWIDTGSYRTEYLCRHFVFYLGEQKGKTTCEAGGIQNVQWDCFCIHEALRYSDYWLSGYTLTPGDVYLFTTNGPSLKSHSRRNRLKAGPEEAGGRALKEELKLIHHCCYWMPPPRCWNWTSNITESLSVSDVSLRCREAKQHLVRRRGQKLTHKKAGLSTGHDGCKDASTLLGPSAPSQEPKDGRTCSCANTWDGNTASFLLHASWYSTYPVCDFMTCMCVYVCMSPATSRLDNNNHFEYPTKYKKLPEHTHKCHFSEPKGIMVTQLSACTLSVS